jgi:hypothetical protein
MDKDGLPLRAIILDNDEASGYYAILFDFWEFLNKSQLGKRIIFSMVIMFWIEYSGKTLVFRKGLFDFLVKAVEARDAGRLDAIIMYTHQNADFTWQDWSIPAFLSILMGHIVIQKRGRRKLRQPLFNHVLTFPPKEYRVSLPGGWTQKSFSRVLNLYPTKPKDIRGMIFVDDNATPKMVEADSISPDKKTLDSWERVRAYRLDYTGEDFKECIRQFQTFMNEQYNIEIPDDSAVIEEISADVHSDGRDGVKFKEGDYDETFDRLNRILDERYPKL